MGECEVKTVVSFVGWESEQTGKEMTAVKDESGAQKMTRLCQQLISINGFFRRYS